MDETSKIKFVLKCITLGVQPGFIDFDTNHEDNPEATRMVYSVPEKAVREGKEYTSKAITKYVETEFAKLMSDDKMKFTPKAFKFSSFVRQGEVFTEEDGQRVFDTIKEKTGHADDEE